MVSSKTMRTVTFTEAATLPRFSVAKGEQWTCRPERITNHGLRIGGGLIRPDGFKVEGRPFCLYCNDSGVDPDNVTSKEELPCPICRCKQ